MSSFCRPVADGVWETKLDSGFGPLTPCIVEGLIINISQCVLCVVTFYRIWLLVRGHHLQRFHLKRTSMQGFLIFLASALFSWPLAQLLLGVSTVNLDGERSFAPFEVLTLLLESSMWLSILCMLLLELKTYVREFRWYIRFGLVYVLVAHTTLYIFMISLRSFYSGWGFKSYSIYFATQGAFGLLCSFHLPDLVPYVSYTPIPLEDVESFSDYEALPGKEQACPERHANILSRLLFCWMTPLMKQGAKRPIGESDIWKLDQWDKTEQLYAKFQRCWGDECAKDRPSLLRALNRSLGARFWLGGVFKIGNDASQFVGPIFLGLLLQSMQRGDPAWVGYFYAASIFVGVMFGVICEGQYFLNVLRVGFRTRATLVAAIFCKTLRLTQEGRKGFASGRIVNLMTTDAEALQQICQQLHALWSAPIRVVVCICLLFNQLGYACFVGASVLLLLFPLQAVMINRMKKFNREGLQRTDKRISLVNEILAAMDIVKCYAWENSFQSRVLEIRNDELGWFRSAMILGSINSFVLNSAPVLVTVIAFGMYTLFGGDLTPAKAFTSLSLFAVLRFPLFMLPNLITQIANAKISLQRLQDFLLAEDRVLQPNLPISDKLPAISVRNGSFMWDRKVDRKTLSDINFHVDVGTLVAIVGGTGEGKTSVISAILGELPAVGDSEVILRGRVAYVSQVSWIFNGTVRDNILFGSSYDPVRYKKAIHVSALNRDLQLLPGGDLAEIGERGVNISGGQKQRISIARAVYANADVYIFDDPLSALDAHVARQVFETCIRDELCGKTRVLVTNQLHFLSRVDKILLVHEGKIKEQGTYEELMGGGKLFQKLMENAGKMEESTEECRDEDTSVLLDSTATKYTDGSDSFSEKSKERNDRKSILVRREERETGILSWSVLQRYQSALGGSWVVFVLFFCYIMAEVARASSSTWLSVWTNASFVKNHGPLFYTVIYGLLSSLQIITTLVNSLWVISSGLYAAQRLHNGMLAAILRAPMPFFNTTPLGRIINRFARDTGDIDRSIASTANMFLSSIFQLLSTFTMIGLVSTTSLWAIFPLLILFHSVYIYYQSTAREVKRLDSVTRSPVYAQFSEALNGLATIRAYKVHDRLAQINGNTMDNNVRFTLVNISLNRWLAIRLEFVGGLMIWLTAIFAVLANQRVSQVSFAAQMGLLLSYALNITNLMTSTLRQASVGENSFNAVERVGAYTELTPEAPLVIEGNRPPSGWPSKGTIAFKNVVMRYRSDLPPVLHGLTATIHPKEKVGIVGRTGAGKSSMFNTLFRIVEPESGQILIDGLDICKFGLSDLRKSLSIIPQIPVLFSGTVRFNLDPFQEHNDADLWEALDRANLKSVIQRSALGIDSEVVENGENFSVGQRQLLSLARALLRRSRVLVLDEATAAVDVGTDAIIQRTIREEFKKCTMLVIAHRLNTIIDCNRILVLDVGQVKEFDTPKNLLLDESSMFFGMVHSTGAANAEYLKNIVIGKTCMKYNIDKQIVEPRKKWAAIENQISTSQWALAMPLRLAHQDLEAAAEKGTANNILQKTRDAARMLQDVLQGQHDEDIQNELTGQEMPQERWWSSLLRVVGGFGVLSQRVGNRLQSQNLLADHDFDWVELPSTNDL